MNCEILYCVNYHFTFGVSAVKLYEFTNSKGEKVLIRQDKPALYKDGGMQPAHFNAGFKKDIKLKQHHYYGN